MPDGLDLPLYGQGPTHGGTASPVLGILGALAPAVQGFMQGRQFREQEQDRSRKQAMDTIQLISQMGQNAADPNAFSSNPDTVKQLTNAFGTLGMKVPMRTIAPTQPGQQPMQAIDPSAMGWTPSFQGWTEKNLSSLEQIPQDQRGSLYKALGISATPEELQNVATLPYLPNAADQIKVMNSLGAQLAAVGKGNLTPDQFTQFVRLNKPILDRYGIDPTSLLDDQMLGQMGAATTARISQMQSLGILDKTRAQTLIEETPSIIQRNIASAGLANARTQEIPQQLALAGQRLDIASQNLQVRKQELTQKINSAHDLPALTGAMNALRAQRDADQKTYQFFIDAAQKAQANLLDPNNAATAKKWMDQATALKGRVDEETGTLNDFNNNYTTAVSNALHKKGAPLNWQATPHALPGKQNAGRLPDGTPVQRWSDGTVRDAKGRKYDKDGNPL